MSDPQALLTAVEAAITAIVSGGVAEYSEGDQRLRNLSLSELTALRTQLQQEVAAAANGGSTMVFGQAVPLDEGG
jgi:hypothetical protein